VRADLSGLARAGSLRLQLFPDLVLEARRKRVEVRAPGEYSWFGAVEGVEGSMATFAVKGEEVAGRIRLPGRVHNILSLGGGAFLIEEVDPSSLPGCGGAVVEPGQAETLSGEMEAEGPFPEHPGPMERQDDGSIIDVLVVYTPAARSTETQIQLVLDETNETYLNSEVDQRLRLVHHAETDYVESGNGAVDLDRLRRQSDGHMDEVHQLRDEHCADLVTLWVDRAANICGIAYLMTFPGVSFENQAFSVIVRSCAFGELTQAHEFGHNMGCAHDRDNAGTQGAYAYSYGYQHPLGFFRTIMAYPNGCPGNCPRFPNFSNPDIFLAGAPTGVPAGHPDSADNTTTLNNTSWVVSNFRDSAPCTSAECVEDPYEPDGNCFDAPVLQAPGQEDHVHCEDYSDWVRIGAIGGTTYTFETGNLGTLSDTALQLLGPDCFTLLEQDDDGGSGGGASRIIWMAPEDGCYALRVSEEDRTFGVDREYTLSITGQMDPGICCPITDPENLMLAYDRRAVPVEVTLTWDGVFGEEWNIYKGAGVTAPFAYIHECYASALTERSYMETAGDGFTRELSYYLVTSALDCGETSLGTGSSGTERPNTVPCPR
jgi:hypothetical protein